MNLLSAGILLNEQGLNIALVETNGVESVNTVFTQVLPLVGELHSNPMNTEHIHALYLQAVNLLHEHSANKPLDILGILAIEGISVQELALMADTPIIYNFFHNCHYYGEHYGAKTIEHQLLLLQHDIKYGVVLDDEGYLSFFANDAMPSTHHVGIANTAASVLQNNDNSISLEHGLIDLYNVAQVNAAYSYTAQQPQSLPGCSVMDNTVRQIMQMLVKHLHNTPYYLLCNNVDSELKHRIIQMCTNRNIATIPVDSENINPGVVYAYMAARVLKGMPLVWPRKNDVPQSACGGMIHIADKPSAKVLQSLQKNSNLLTHNTLELTLDDMKHLGVTYHLDIESHVLLYTTSDYAIWRLWTNRGCYLLKQYNHSHSLYHILSIGYQFDKLGVNTLSIHKHRGNYDVLIKDKVYALYKDVPLGLARKLNKTQINNVAHLIAMLHMQNLQYDIDRNDSIPTLSSDELNELTALLHAYSLKLPIENEKLIFCSEQMQRHSVSYQKNYILTNGNYIDNIMWQDNRPIIIDWVDVSRRHPTEDLVMALIYYSALDGKKYNETTLLNMLNSYKAAKGSIIQPQYALANILLKKVHQLLNRLRHMPPNGTQEEVAQYYIHLTDVKHHVHSLEYLEKRYQQLLNLLC